ncbi:MAG TPA: GspJ family type II secretion system protein [Nitrospiraceae bacterium]|nr:GspJ family type II secretion system protein [Nitrospiraceae bacterium]
MSFLNPGSRPEGGFTLIEVLVTVAILAILIGIVALTFSSTTRILEAVQQDGGLEHRARICLGLITDDMLMARLQRRFPWSTRNGEFDGQPADMVAFVSASHVRYRDNAPEADLTRVLYVREGDRLSRISLRNLYGVLPGALERVDLATGVVAFNVRYYDGTLLAWVDEWDEDRKVLPRAVRIELTLRNSRKETRTFTDWVAIPAQSL